MSRLTFVWLGLLCGSLMVSTGASSAQDAVPNAPSPGYPEPAAAPASTLEAAPGARSAKNVLFVELLGNGALYSVNYARFVSDDVSLRIGFDYFSFSVSSGSSSGSATLVLMPLMVNYLGIGGIDHKLELGIGPVLAYASATVDSSDGLTSGEGVGIGGTAVIGYRYIPHDGGFTFNVGFTPIFGQGGFLPWVGLGLGAAF